MESYMPQGISLFKYMHEKVELIETCRKRPQEIPGKWRKRRQEDTRFKIQPTQKEYEVQQWNWGESRNTGIDDATAGKAHVGEQDHDWENQWQDSPLSTQIASNQYSLFKNQIWNILNSWRFSKVR